MQALLLRTGRVGILLVALLAASTPVHSRALTSTERITSLARAASDPGLAAWQREFYSERLSEALAGERAVRDELAAPLAVTDTQPVWSLIADSPRRQGHTLVIDDATGKLYAFGGRNGTAVSNTVFVLDPNGAREWHTLVTQGTPPPGRMAHAAFLDAANRRMLVFGGTDEDGSYLADLWALSLDDTPTWTELTPAGDLPEARANFVATVDTLNDRLLMFGGGNGGFSPLTDLWSLSLAPEPAWTSLTPGGAWPAPSSVSALLVDEGRHRLALVGVQTVNYSTNWTIWWLPLDSPSPAWSSWVTPYSYSPSTYTSGSAVFAIDEAGDRLVFANVDYYYGVIWLPLAGSATQWSTTTCTGAIPPFRSGRALAFDAAHRRLFVSGGSAGGYPNGRMVSEVSSLDLGGLSQWETIAGDPASRIGHALAFDGPRGKVHMFGGLVDSTGSGYAGQISNSLWAIASGSPSPAWAPEPASGSLLPRSGASLVVDPVRDRLLLFGGTNGSVMTNEVWQRPLSGSVTWTRVLIGGSLPHERSDAACTYDPVGDRLLVFGGSDNTLGYLDDIWALGLAGTPHWTRLQAPGGPPPTRGAVLTWDPIHSCAYLVGGSRAYSYGQIEFGPAATWKLTLAPAPAWQVVSHGLPANGGYPEDEFTCAAFYDQAQERLVRVAFVYNYSTPSPYPTVTTLAPSADTSWTNLPVGGSPPRQSPDAHGVFDTQSRRLLWFGGTDLPLEGTWALSFGPAPLAVPPAVAGFAAPARVAPNPAHAACTVRFALPRAGRVSLELLDLSGRRVRGPVVADLPAGPAELELRDLGSLPAGVYFARLGGALERRTRVAVIH